MLKPKNILVPKLVEIAEIDALGTRLFKSTREILVKIYYEKSGNIYYKLGKKLFRVSGHQVYKKA